MEKKKHPSKELWRIRDSAGRKDRQNSGEGVWEANGALEKCWGAGGFTGPPRHCPRRQFSFPESFWLETLRLLFSSSFYMWRAEHCALSVFLPSIPAVLNPSPLTSPWMTDTGVCSHPDSQHGLYPSPNDNNVSHLSTALQRIYEMTFDSLNCSMSSYYYPRLTNPFIH